MKFLSQKSRPQQYINNPPTTTTPLIVFMLQNPQTSCWSLKSHTKLKLTAAFLAVLLVLQYFFSASIYDVRIFDYSLTQFYIWPYTNSNNNVTTPPTPPTTTMTSNETAVLSSTIISILNVTNGSTIIGDNITSILNHKLQKISSKLKLSAIDMTMVPTSMNTYPVTTTSPKVLESCPVVPPVLVGPIKVWFDYPSFAKLEELYPFLEDGGHGKPKSCKSNHKVAIILPYRDREKHLRAFLHNLHSLLTKQQLDYAIYVVEQIANQTFNRAKLMNVGYAEAQKQYNWQCVIFHDVDLFPEDDRNLYTCPDQPRHMSVAVDKFNYQLPYADIFGGISALTKEQFEKMNGFSNDYWGWGGEDDDMASRVKMHNYQISRYPSNIARYKMVKHTHDKENPVNTCRYSLMYKVKQRWKIDGLSTLRYKVVKLEKRKLYTWMLVDLLETESKAILEKQKLCETSKT